MKLEVSVKTLKNKNLSYPAVSQCSHPRHTTVSQNSSCHATK